MENYNHEYDQDISSSFPPQTLPLPEVSPSFFNIYNGDNESSSYLGNKSGGESNQASLSPNGESIIESVTVSFQTLQVLEDGKQIQETLLSDGFILLDLTQDYGTDDSQEVEMKSDTMTASMERKPSIERFMIESGFWCPEKANVLSQVSQRSYLH